MKGIPLAKFSDRNQVDQLSPLLEGRRCVVVGSAPLRTKHAEIAADEVAMPVNGGISSVAGKVDIWVLNSKAQDAPGSLMRPLHHTMLRQGSNRAVGHILFLRGPKVASEQGTLATLGNLRCSCSTWNVLDKPTKLWIEREVCDRIEEKKPCSSGILAVAVALWAGAAAVRLTGFSLVPGYHYISKERPQSWWRDHIAADRRALLALKRHYGERFELPFAMRPELAVSA